MRQPRGVSALELAPQLVQDVVVHLCPQVADGPGAHDVVGHQQHGLGGLGHPQQAGGAHAGAAGLHRHEGGVLGGRAQGQVTGGGQAPNADLVPDVGEESGHLPVGVEEGDVVALAGRVPHCVHAVDRGAFLGQGLAGGLGQDGGQVDVGGRPDRVRARRRPGAPGPGRVQRRRVEGGGGLAAR